MRKEKEQALQGAVMTIGLVAFLVFVNVAMALTA